MATQFSAEFADGAAPPELFNTWVPGPVRLFTREQVPDIAFFDDWRQYLPAFMSISAKLGVSQEVKDTIEALEPGRHQFFSVHIHRKEGTKPFLKRDGTPLQDPYYVLIPGVHLDAVWVEKSDVEVKRQAMGQVVVRLWPGRSDKVVLRHDVIQGHHFWQGQWQLGGCKFFSDELVRIARERRWEGLEFTHLREE